MKMAKEYGVEKNMLFRLAAEQYTTQRQIIEQIKAGLSEEGLLTAKEYVKGRENLYANPLIKELPRHIDSANKTMKAMLEIIIELGIRPPIPLSADDLLDAFLKDAEG